MVCGFVMSCIIVTLMCFLIDRDCDVEGVDDIKQNIRVVECMKMVS